MKDGTTVRQLGLISSVRRWEELAGTRGQTQVSNYCWALKERSCETMKAVTLNAFQLLRDEPLLRTRSGLRRKMVEVAKQGWELDANVCRLNGNVTVWELAGLPSLLSRQNAKICYLTIRIVVTVVIIWKQLEFCWNLTCRYCQTHFSWLLLYPYTCTFFVYHRITESILVQPQLPCHLGCLHFCVWCPSLMGVRAAVSSSVSSVAFYFWFNCLLNAFVLAS